MINELATAIAAAASPSPETSPAAMTDLFSVHLSLPKSLGNANLLNAEPMNSAMLGGGVMPIPVTKPIEENGNPTNLEAASIDLAFLKAFRIAI